MDDVVLRPAEAEDRHALGQLLEQSWWEHWGPHVTDAARRRYAAETPQLAYVEGHWPEMVLAVRGGAIVGMFHRDGDYLEAIHVAPGQIGKGIGRLLMTRAEADGARRLDVRSFNQSARAFYAARGWREVRRIDGTEMGAPVVTVAMELREK